MIRSTLLSVWIFAIGLVRAAPPSQPSIPLAILGQDLRIDCWIGNLDGASTLLNEGAPLEETDNMGRTPLFLACHGNPDLVKLLLDRGAKVNVKNENGDTPISIACENGILPNAQMLLDHGADLNVSNRWGRTPLMLAAREGHDDVVSFLLQHHVDVNFCRTNDPALVYAVLSDHLSVVRTLLQAGALCERPPPVEINPRDNPGTLVTLAAFSNDQQLLDLILQHGGKINEQNAIGIGALLQTCISSRNSSIIKYLLDHGANPNLADETGQTPLMAAAENQDVSIVDTLLDRGARIDARDRQGRTALILSTIILASEEVQELIREKADVNIEDGRGETALTYAGDRGDIDLVQLLEAAGATRRNLHIIAKQRTDPPLSRAQLWALAVGALYAQWDGYSHEDVFSWDDKESDLKSLQQDWNITDRAGLLRQIDELEAPPTWSGIFQNEMSDVLSTASLWPKFKRATKLLYLDLRWRLRMDRSWNLCRAADLIRIGMNVGFLNEDEGWPLLLQNARRAQSAFGSWRELCQSMLDKREIWAGGKDPSILLCAQLLLNPKDPNSPWNKLDWNTDLGPPPS